LHPRPVRQPGGELKDFVRGRPFEPEASAPFEAVRDDDAEAVWRRGTPHREEAVTEAERERSRRPLRLSILNFDCSAGSVVVDVLDLVPLPKPNEERFRGELTRPAGVDPDAPLSDALEVDRSVPAYRGRPLRERRAIRVARLPLLRE
jgi:hypothetical protein